MRAIHLEMEDEIYLLRSPLRGCAGRLFQIAGVRVPPLAEKVKIIDLPREALRAAADM